MIKKKICVFAFAAWMSTLSITAYGATGWVKMGKHGTTIRKMEP